MSENLTRGTAAVPILLWAAGFTALYPVFSFISPRDYSLPTVSALAFLFGFSVVAFTVIAAFYAEAVLRRDAPFWRARLVLAGTVNYFGLVVILTGVRIPSVEALGLLGAGAVLAGLCAWALPPDKRTIETGLGDPSLFDPGRRIWPDRGGIAILVPGGAVLSVTAGLALFAPDMAFALVCLIVLAPLQMPLIPQNRAPWRARDMLLMAVVASTLTGLVTAR